MTLLGIDAGARGVTAVVVTDDGEVVATAHHGLTRLAPSPGWVEHAPEEVWRAALAAAREVLGQVDRNAVRGLGVTGQRGTVVLWDRDTLGSPRPAIAGADRRTGTASPADRLAWLAEHEPHTWALVEADRYAVGTLDSYLVARMTRGLEHLTDVANAADTGLLDLATGDWDDGRCADAGVPRDALPELVRTWGDLATTEPRTFLDLAVPLAAVAGTGTATLAALGCVEPGAAVVLADPDGAGATILAPTGAVLDDGDTGSHPTVAWRTPDGDLAHALEGAAVAGTSPAARPTALRVDGATSDAWCQDLADRCAVPVERSRHREPAAVGAALFAGLGVGVWDSPTDLRDLWAPDRTFRPGPSAPA